MKKRSKPSSIISTTPFKKNFIYNLKGGSGPITYWCTHQLYNQTVEHPCRPYNTLKIINFSLHGPPKNLVSYSKTNKPHGCSFLTEYINIFNPFSFLTISHVYPNFQNNTDTEDNILERAVFRKISKGD